jgi:hypothetical protein
MTASIQTLLPKYPRNHKPLVLLLLARVSSSVAFQMLGVAVGWQMYAITGSALYLGLVGLAQFLPIFLLTSVQS